MQFWQTVVLAEIGLVLVVCVVLGVAIGGVTTGIILELLRRGKGGVRGEKSKTEGVLESGLRGVVGDKSSGQVWNGVD